LEIRLLGPLELVTDDGLVLLPTKQRRLLAALLVRVGETRSTDVLIDAVWGEAPPASASSLLQVYVSQLRKALPAPVHIATLGSGYAIVLGEASLDAARFERLLREGKEAINDGNPALAASVLGRALGLWRGQAYGELAYEEFARGEAERLEELRRVALEERIEAELQLGRHVQLLPELRAVAAAEPLRERFQAQAMLALYRCGRQSEALDLYAGLRAHLHDELGLEPGVELRELQRRILQHDPELITVPDAEVQPFRLPAPPNRLLGRERELEQLRDLLRRGDVRLLVLAGAGGSGKTRLALEAARELSDSFANGAAFVDLAPLRDPDLVVGTIARALGIQELSGQSLEALKAALRPRELLLVLDNAEHLRAAAPTYVELLAHARHLTLLVTSRAVLHVSGEHVYPVEPLASEAAVALFCERAHAADPRFHTGADEEEAIRRICARLDGLPLAIELAAARAKVLSPPALLARLEQRLPILTGGVRDLPGRQRTLRDTIAWSYELLDETEQTLFSRLAVFPASFTLEAAETICDADLDTLGSLVDTSLVRQSERRLAMLETIREYAGECLQVSDERDQIRRRHLDFYLALAEEAKTELETWFPRPAAERRSSTSFERLELEHDNFRTCLDSARRLGERRLELRLASALGHFWAIRSHFWEGRKRITDALARDPGAPAGLRGHAQWYSALMACWQGDFKTGRMLAEEAAAGYEATGDKRGVAKSLILLGVVSMGEGEFESAKAILEESLSIYERLGDELGIHVSMDELARVALEQGDFDEARRQFEAALAYFRTNEYEHRVANSLSDLGFAALGQADYEEARVAFEESLRQSSELGWKWNVAFELVGLAAVLTKAADLERAARLLAQVESLVEEIQLQLPGYTRMVRDRTQRELESLLDPRRFAERSEEGRSTGLEDIVSLALSDID
jgi:predicted ATPase/DNA-binding SARP family transcriptional activator/Tfp pilus assembly protein PilF